VFGRADDEQTAALGILAGTKLDLPEVGATAAEKDEWIVVLGGSGCVGHFMVQVRSISLLATGDI
jgi:NADPH:quinone reductase-like Zn-dependent oxidoreductase